MKNWIDTVWHRYYFEEDRWSNASKSQKLRDGAWEWNGYSASAKSVDDALNKVMDYCNEHHYEVKSVTPLIKGKTFEYAQSWDTGGFGKGWGTSYTEGVAIFLQKIETVSDEEFSNRLEVKNLTKSKKQILDKIDELKEVDKAKIGSSHIQASINALESRVNGKVTIKSSFLGKDKFVYGDEEYQTEQEAYQALENEKTKIETLKNQILDETSKEAALSTEQENQINQLKLELESIDEKLSQIPTDFRP